LITPPHVAAACLIATSAEEIYKNAEGTSLVTLYSSVIAINLLLHYILDIVPHGHTVNPFDMGDDLRFLYLELGISAGIIASIMIISDHPLLILSASLASLLPDYVSGSLARLRLPKPIYLLLFQIQRFHFFIHWFEQKDKKGKRIVPFPSKLELILQGGFVLLCIILVLLIKYK